MEGDSSPLDGTGERGGGAQLSCGRDETGRAGREGRIEGASSPLDGTGGRAGGGQLPSGRVGAPRPLRHEGLRPVTSPGAGRQRGGAG